MGWATGPGEGCSIGEDAANAEAKQLLGALLGLVVFKCRQVPKNPVIFPSRIYLRWWWRANSSFFQADLKPGHTCSLAVLPLPSTTYFCRGSTCVSRLFVHPQGCRSRFRLKCPMATSGYSAAPSRPELVELQILCLTGQGFTLQVPPLQLGREVQEMVSQQLPWKTGAKIVLHHGESTLMLDQSLQEQGIGKAATLSCTYIPTDVYAAWCFIKLNRPQDERSALEGLTHLDALTNDVFECLYNLPQSLRKLKFTVGTSISPGNKKPLTLDSVKLPSGLQSLMVRDDGQNPSLEGLILPNNLQSLTFGAHSLQFVTLPDRLEKLSFSHSFNESLAGVPLPNSLQRLAFGDRFNESLAEVSLPSGLKSLSFGLSYNHSLEGVTLPCNLQTLSFGERFNQTVEHLTWPNSLQILTFGQYFNQSLAGVTFPRSLRALTLGSQFNQSLEGVNFPDSLQVLAFGFQFNQTLQGVILSSSIQKLTFGAMFNQSLEGVTLPCGLQSLAFGARFGQSMEHVMFPGLKDLTIRFKPMQCLPSSLQSLKLCGNFSEKLETVDLPPKLKSLTFGDRFNQGLEHVTFPAGLETLTFGEHFDQRLEEVTLPCGLRNLTFGAHFDQSLAHVKLPSTLERLTLGSRFNNSLEHVSFPQSLKSIAFGDHFNSSLVSVTFPSSLRTLTFGHQFNQSLHGVDLPDSLQTLTFGQSFNQSLVGVALPSSLVSLAFGRGFEQSLVGVTFPSCLQSLIFDRVFNRYKKLQELLPLQFPSSLESLVMDGVMVSCTAGAKPPARRGSREEGWIWILEKSRCLLESSGDNGIGYTSLESCSGPYTV